MSWDPFFRRFFPADEYASLAYHRQVRAHLPAAGRVLDLGCGDNVQISYYRKAEREVWGTDLVRHPRLRHAAWFRALGPKGEIPFDHASFDLVTSSMVLEHVQFPGRFLREVARVLRPGGRFVALTVNADHYITRINRLLPHRLTQRLVYRLYGRPEHDTFPTVYRLNTPTQVEGQARRAGLRLVEFEAHANQGYFTVWKPLWRAAVLADAFLERLRPGWGKLYLVLILKKPEDSLALPVAGHAVAS